ncbi:MAG: PH domain-containing protein [Clostridia bacterium]|nr:PH domain-containing protein [Clostridia bacterium]
MKKEINVHEKFKIRFSKAIYALCVGVYALCLAGIIISAWRIVHFGINGFNDVLKYPFLIAVCLFCIVLVTSVLISSQYLVENEYFITKFGFIKSKFKIKDITSILLDRQADKLTVYFGEQFTVITINPDWNERFVRALLSVNPDIDYGFTLSDVNKKN